MTRSLPVAVVDAAADARGVDPEDLDYALADHIDTTALRELSTHDGASWTLSFELPEQNVTVTSDGLILVDGDPVETWT